MYCMMYGCNELKIPSSDEHTYVQGTEPYYVFLVEGKVVIPLLSHIQTRLPGDPYVGGTRCIRLAS